ncbi:DNA polymerase delta subunit Cdm1 [Schizosaccharomyces pombe]
MKKRTTQAKKSGQNTNIRDVFPHVVRSNSSQSHIGKKVSSEQSPTPDVTITTKTLDERIKEDDELSKEVEEAWNQIMAERISEPIHCENITKVEFILHHFDTTARYGPYLGMTRMQRWKRAKNFNLNPPEIVGKILMLEEADEENRKRESLFYDLQTIPG